MLIAFKDTLVASSARKLAERFAEKDTLSYTAA